MRILFANPHPYLPDSTSGREISIHALALRCQARGFDVAVFCDRACAAFDRDDTLPYPVYRAAQPAAHFRAVIEQFRPTVAIYPFGPKSLPLTALGMHAGVKADLKVTNVEAAELVASPLSRPYLMLIAISEFTLRRIDSLLGL